MLDKKFQKLDKLIAKYDKGALAGEASLIPPTTWLQDAVSSAEKCDINGVIKHYSVAAAEEYWIPQLSMTSHESRIFHTLLDEVREVLERILIEKCGCNAKKA